MSELLQLPLLNKTHMQFVLSYGSLIRHYVQSHDDDILEHPGIVNH